MSQGAERFSRKGSRPRVVMLVAGSVKHDSRVRKSASSIRSAGLEVLVLGAVRTDAPDTPVWEQVDGIDLQVVPMPERARPRRQRRDARRVAGLEARRDRLAKRLKQLRRARRSRPSLPDRLLYAVLRHRYGRVRDNVKRLKIRSKVESRDLRERRFLADYEAVWWPIVAELRPDVVHVHDTSGLSVARRAARRGARWVYDAHDHPLPERPAYQERQRAARRRQIARHAAHADAVITVGAPLAEVLSKELGLPQAPALVHNAPPLRTGPTPQPGLRQAAGVASDELLLVYAGTLSGHRLVGVVFEAMTMLPNVQLALVVNPEYRHLGVFLDRAEELAVAERVHVVPMVAPESVAPFLAEASVAVHPLARYSAGDVALPTKLFEYLHAGLPMVVSDSPAMAAFVREHGLGEVAPVDDPQAWAGAIERALSPPFYRDRVSEWEELKREWCWEHQEETLLSVYRELLGPGLTAAAGTRRSTR